MTQPYQAPSEDDLCPSFKKLCIRKPICKGWSIVPFNSSGIFNKSSNSAINEVKIINKKELQLSPISVNLLKQRERNNLILTKLMPRLLPIEDSLNVKNDNEMEVD